MHYFLEARGNERTFNEMFRAATIAHVSTHFQEYTLHKKPLRCQRVLCLPQTHTRSGNGQMYQLQ